MSIISQRTVSKLGRQYKVMLEQYNNSAEMVNDLKTRSLTSSSFDDKSRKADFDEWDGVKSYGECLEYLSNGYQPTVDALRDVSKATVQGNGKRIGFKNDIVGGMPIVPLAMMGIPNSMVNTYIKPIKAKVLDVYYDVTCSWKTKSKDIIKAGQTLLATILKLEQEGYKFNLYAVQTYSDSESCDMLVIKVKSSNQPLDLKRMSYTLTHTSFFRVLGFDWYSRTPKGKYRFGYGHNLGVELNENSTQLNEFAQQLFGKNSIYISAFLMHKSGDKDTYIDNMINPK